MMQHKKYKREPDDFGLPPRAAGGGPNYIAGIPMQLLTDDNIDVVLLTKSSNINSGLMSYKTNNRPFFSSPLRTN
tara:strand:- start:960 stop:1184 length:225 start_codon:yes stop_codon:yes gene_type:complete